MVEGKSVKVVSPGYLKDKNLTIPEGAYSSKAETVVFVLVDDKLTGYIALAGAIRPECGQSRCHVDRSQGFALAQSKICAEALAI